MLKAPARACTAALKFLCWLTEPVFWLIATLLVPAVEFIGYLMTAAPLCAVSLVVGTNVLVHTHSNHPPPPRHSDPHATPTSRPPTPTHAHPRPPTDTTPTPNRSSPPVADDAVSAVGMVLQHSTHRTHTAHTHRHTHTHTGTTTSTERHGAAAPTHTAQHTHTNTAHTAHTHTHTHTHTRHTHPHTCPHTPTQRQLLTVLVGDPLARTCQPVTALMHACMDG